MVCRPEVRVVGIDEREKLFDHVALPRGAQGAEIDLLCIAGGKRIGVEVKRADAPSLTPSMRSARESLELDSIVVFHPGDREYELADDVYVIPASKLCDRTFKLPARRRKKRPR